MIIFCSSLSSTETPSIGILIIFIIQGLKLFVSFSLTENIGISEAIIILSDLDKPFGINFANFSHILLSGKNQFVIDNKLGGLSIQTGSGMNEDLLVIEESSIAFLRVLPRSMEKEPRSDGFSDFIIIMLRRLSEGKLIALNQGEQLLSDILRAFH